MHHFYHLMFHSLTSKYKFVLCPCLFSILFSLCYFKMYVSHWTDMDVWCLHYNKVSQQWAGLDILSFPKIIIVDSLNLLDVNEERLGWSKMQAVANSSKSWIVNAVVSQSPLNQNWAYFNHILNALLKSNASCTEEIKMCVTVQILMNVTVNTFKCWIFVTESKKKTSKVYYFNIKCFSTASCISGSKANVAQQHCVLSLKYLNAYYQCI